MPSRRRARPLATIPPWSATLPRTARRNGAVVPNTSDPPASTVRPPSASWATALHAGLKSTDRPHRDMVGHADAGNAGAPLVADGGHGFVAQRRAGRVGRGMNRGDRAAGPGERAVQGRRRPEVHAPRDEPHVVERHPCGRHHERRRGRRPERGDDQAGEDSRKRRARVLAAHPVPFVDVRRARIEELPRSADVPLRGRQDDPVRVADPDRARRVELERPGSARTLCATPPVAPKTRVAPDSTYIAPSKTSVLPIDTERVRPAHREEVTKQDAAGAAEL